MAVVTTGLRAPIDFDSRLLNLAERIISNLKFGELAGALVLFWDSAILKEGSNHFVFWGNYDDHSN